jgi:hypothetical protein
MSCWLQKPQFANQPGIELGITDADKNGFMATIHQLNKDEGLDLLLHTPGGSMAATESLVEYLRAMFRGNVTARPSAAKKGLACANDPRFSVIRKTPSPT